MPYWNMEETNKSLKTCKEIDPKEGTVEEEAVVKTTT